MDGGDAFASKLDLLESNLAKKEAFVKSYCQVMANFSAPSHVDRLRAIGRVKKTIKKHLEVDIFLCFICKEMALAQPSREAVAKILRNTAPCITNCQAVVDSCF